MENLNFIVDNTKIAELLGEQNFTTKESAIFELIKNSFDAKAKNVKVIIDSSCISVIDDGIGMSNEDMKNKWMVVGKSDKLYKIEGTSRIYSGSKGIGKFALARLGRKVYIKTKKNEEVGLFWESDWNTSYIKNLDEAHKNGTSITICDLRDKWEKDDVKILVEFLSRVCLGDDMNIDIKFGNFNFQVSNPLKNLHIGVNYLSSIDFYYDSKKKEIDVLIKSDEFNDEAKMLIPHKNLSETRTIIDVLKESYKTGVNGEKIENERVYSSVGNFYGKLYFLLNPNKNDIQKFMYKHGKVADPISSGIILYRNSFSISSYDGTKDWLKLDYRAKKSPAAATHKTGFWRVRSNQLHGMINIDKNGNKELRDLSNRQDLIQGEEYEAFISIIHMVIENFEKYRQEIIRDIYDFNKEDEKASFSLYDQILKKSKKISDLDQKEQSDLLLEMKTVKDNNEEINSKYTYDVRILNTLATSGLKAASIAHDLENRKDDIENNIDYIIIALKEYGIWESLNIPERTLIKFRNVPKLLEEQQDSSRKIVKFLNIMLSNISKSRFFVKKINIYEQLNEISQNWENDYSWLQIDIFGSRTLEYELPYDVLSTIFDNLILNSKEQNESMTKLSVSIQFFFEDGRLNIKYADNGVGLNKKYIDDPYRILNVHETTRENGHGLGMWIVNNTILSQDGKIIDIGSNNGFYINFLLGDVKNGK